ncbi:hypothetical protein QCA50_019039 [Cerrena zonata]|uniref:Uncharacterized protein n=1 Tax=Cerrena zonata TaxID=2478898 RepID=A0AAW0FK43_9APHY
MPILKMLMKDPVASATNLALALLELLALFNEDVDEFTACSSLWAWDSTRNMLLLMNHKPPYVDWI